jgi:signal transduction histidine kinase/ActR/RegA family two-component response regulator
MRASAARKLLSKFWRFILSMKRSSTDEYLIFLLRKNKRIYNVFSIISLILLMITQLTKIRKLLETPYLFAISTILLIGLVLLFLLMRRKSLEVYNSSIYTAILISVFIYSIETNVIDTYLSCDQTLSPYFKFYLGMMYGTFFTFMTVFQATWIENAFICLTITIYASARLLSKNDIVQHNYTPMLWNIALFIFTMGFYYRREKIHRQQYEELRLHQRESEFFAFLLKEVFPSPIIVIKSSFNKKFSSNTEAPIFFNKSASDLLTTNSEEVLFKRLQTFTFLHTNAMEEISATPLTFIELLDRHQAELRECSFSTPVFFETYRVKYLSFKNTSEEEEEQELETKDPSIYFLEMKIGNILWQKEQAVFMILQDKTDDQRVRDIQETVDKNKDKLLATVSHELRTPLNGIIGMIDHVRDSIIDQEQKKELGIALNSARWLLHMINDILDFSRYSNGDLNLNIEEISLKGMLEDVIKLVKFQIKHKGLKLIEDYKDVDNLYITCDPNRFKQILINLLGNALKFTSKGFIKLIIKNEVLLTPPPLLPSQREYNLEDDIILCSSDRKLLAANSTIDESSQHYTEIIVEDTGIGISKENIPRLFKLFGRLNQRDPHINKEGVGLGLAISQNLAQMMLPETDGGGIKVQSIVGRGSRFSFKLKSNQRRIENVDSNVCEWDINAPLTLEKSSSFDRCLSKSLTKSLTNTSGNLSRQRSEIKFEKTKSINKFYKKSMDGVSVLVVDDDQINQLVLKKYLNELGVKIFLASNGQEAVDTVKSQASKDNYFKLILMDCNMPVLDGYEASRQIRALVKSSEIPPLDILALTANVTSYDEARCHQAGMNHFLTKPLFKKTFHIKVLEILQCESEDNQN